MSTNEASNRKRVTVKPTSCPNPLFEKWLLEWRDEAANRNSDLKYCFDKVMLFCICQHCCCTDIPCYAITLTTHSFHRHCTHCGNILSD